MRPYKEIVFRDALKAYFLTDPAHTTCHPYAHFQRYYINGVKSNPDLYLCSIHTDPPHKQNVGGSDIQKSSDIQYWFHAYLARLND